MHQFRRESKKEYHEFLIIYQFFFSSFYQSCIKYFLFDLAIIREEIYNGANGVRNDIETKCIITSKRE